MSVIGAGDVDAAAAAGILHIGPRDVVTPLARERAREAGVEIVSTAPGDTSQPRVGEASGSGTTTSSGTTTMAGGPYPSSPVSQPRSGPTSRPRPAPASASPGPAAVRADGVAAPLAIRPPSGALYRRGAPLPAAVRQPGDATSGRVVVVGAGHVGMITAMRLADADVFTEIVLVDIDEGRAKGIALDLTHTAALSGFATRIRGTATVEDAGPADYVVITAGRARTPGMSRADLISTNAAIVGDVAARVARTSPNAVIVVVTNPLDEMTQHAWTSSGFPAERVVGMAGVLDTARFQALLALTGVERADRIAAFALGSHGEEMVMPLSHADAAGRPVTGLIDRAELDAIVGRARGSGAEVVGLLGTGSAFMAPGMSAARMVLAMAADTGEVMPAAVLADGAYGITDVYVGLPVRLGRRGVQEIVEIDLHADELAALQDAAERIRERLGQLVP